MPLSHNPKDQTKDQTFGNYKHNFIYMAQHPDETEKVTMSVIDRVEQDSCVGDYIVSGHVDCDKICIGECECRDCDCGGSCHSYGSIPSLVDRMHSKELVNSQGILVNQSGK